MCYLSCGFHNFGRTILVHPYLVDVGCTTTYYFSFNQSLWYSFIFVEYFVIFSIRSTNSIASWRNVVKLTSSFSFINNIVFQCAFILVLSCHFNQRASYSSVYKLLHTSSFTAQCNHRANVITSLSDVRNMSEIMQGSTYGGLSPLCGNECQYIFTIQTRNLLSSSALVNFNSLSYV